jgi:hypothetical protein
MRRAAALLVGSLALGCTAQGGVENVGYFRVLVTAVDGGEVPSPASPQQPNLGDVNELWSFTVEAIDGQGNLDPSFNGFARVLTVPGSVSEVAGADGVGRNVRFTAGRAAGDAVVTAVFGPSRLWVQDIGYVPAGPGQTPACANGADDDGDVLVDFPNDPGCAFADDMTEESGTLLTGVSQEISYLLPTVADVQGRTSETPYEAVSADIRTAPNEVVVTRVSSNGFFVTDLSDPDHPSGYNHIFAFNFNTPTDMRVCDRLSSLSGTVTEFFGFTEVSFPSYEIGLWDPLSPSNACNFLNEIEVCGADAFCRRGTCQPCRVPDPVELDDVIIQNDAAMERLESGLVTMQQFRIAPLFGPGYPAVSGDPGAYLFTFDADASNCDFSGDGVIDFFDDLEGACSNACGADPNCSDWIGYSSRGNYKVSRGALMMQANTSTAGGFDPVRNKGATLQWLTGTLRHFSGGSLNWTVETRCSDDLVCAFDEVCAAAIVPATQACKTPPTEDDNDAATN